MEDLQLIAQTDKHLWERKLHWWPTFSPILKIQCYLGRGICKNRSVLFNGYTYKCLEAAELNLGKQVLTCDYLYCANIDTRNWVRIILKCGLCKPQRGYNNFNWRHYFKSGMDVYLWWIHDTGRCLVKLHHLFFPISREPFHLFPFHFYTPLESFTYNQNTWIEAVRHPFTKWVPWKSEYQCEGCKNALLKGLSVKEEVIHMEEK